MKNTPLHTPGPWFRGRQSENGWHTVRVADTGCTNGRVVAEVLEPEDCPLIAAAPDMLAACESMLSAFGGNVPDWLADEAAQMLAAIAKAKGGAA